MRTGLAVCLVLTIFLLTPQGGVCMPLKIMTSFHPLDEFIKKVGGDEVEVELFTQSSADPHAFELKPSHIRSADKADLIIFLGIGFEFWAEGLVSNHADKVKFLYPHPAELNRPHEYFDPHVWLDPRSVIEITEHVRDILCGLQQDSCMRFLGNQSRFASELETFDQETRTRILRWELKRFIALHPAWGHFARRYGLEQVGGIIEHHDDEPSIKQAAELIELVKKEGVRAAFIENESRKEQVQALLGTGVRLVEVDSLGKGGRSYLDYMKENVDHMAEAMAKE